MAVEDIAGGDFVAITPWGDVVRADGVWPEVVGVALCPARAGDEVVVLRAGRSAGPTVAGADAILVAELAPAGAGWVAVFQGSSDDH